MEGDKSGYVGGRILVNNLTDGVEIAYKNSNVHGIFGFENGVETSIEIGAGKVLTGMIKRISGEANTISVSEPNQIDEFKL